MAWQKGKPRKGHINADGKPHASRGERLAVIMADPERYRAIETDKRPKALIVVKTAIAATTPRIHGDTRQPIIEPCPKCGFAYADGGYCPDCGWTVWNGSGERVRIQV